METVHKNFEILNVFQRIRGKPPGPNRPVETSDSIIITKFYHPEFSLCHSLHLNISDQSMKELQALRIDLAMSSHIFNTSIDSISQNYRGFLAESMSTPTEFVVALHDRSVYPLNLVAQRGITVQPGGITAVRFSTNEYSYRQCLKTPRYHTVGLEPTGTRRRTAPTASWKSGLTSDSTALTTHMLAKLHNYVQVRQGALNSEELRSGCNLPNCEETHYGTSFSYSPWLINDFQWQWAIHKLLFNRKGTLDYLQHAENESYIENPTYEFNEYSSIMRSVNVYRENSYVTINEEVELTTVSNLISSVGGIMSIYVGITFTLVAEFFDFLFCVARAAALRSRKAAPAEPSDDRVFTMREESVDTFPAAAAAVADADTIRAARRAQNKSQSSPHSSIKRRGASPSRTAASPSVNSSESGDVRPTAQSSAASWSRSRSWPPSSRASISRRARRGSRRWRTAGRSCRRRRSRSDRNRPSASWQVAGCGSDRPAHRQSSRPNSSSGGGGSLADCSCCCCCRNTKIAQETRCSCSRRREASVDPPAVPDASSWKNSGQCDSRQSCARLSSLQRRSRAKSSQRKSAACSCITESSTGASCCGPSRWRKVRHQANRRRSAGPASVGSDKTPGADARRAGRSRRRAKFAARTLAADSPTESQTAARLSREQRRISAATSAAARLAICVQAGQRLLRVDSGSQGGHQPGLSVRRHTARLETVASKLGQQAGQLNGAGQIWPTGQDSCDYQSHPAPVHRRSRPEGSRRPRPEPESGPQAGRQPSQAAGRTERQLKRRQWPARRRPTRLAERHARSSQEEFGQAGRRVGQLTQVGQVRAQVAKGAVQLLKVVLADTGAFAQLLMIGLQGGGQLAGNEGAD
uniref:FMRFamide-activated amiloride-sensitive sodium channel n=1 Tax=Macrostomum lignano TaxID=282301 RepID=A0A1I8FC13_9PLAT